MRTDVANGCAPPHRRRVHYHDSAGAAIEGHQHHSVVTSLQALCVARQTVRPRRCRCLSPPPFPAPCPELPRSLDTRRFGAPPPRAAATFTIVPALSDCRMAHALRNEGACPMWVEDVATGSAAGPLAGALAGRTLHAGIPLATTRCGLRSLLRCRKPAETAPIEVGGSVVLVVGGRFQ